MAKAPTGTRAKAALTKKTTPSVGKAPKTHPVGKTITRSVPDLFTDVQIIAAVGGEKSPIGFPDEQGTYENPDVEIAAGKLTKPLPQSVSCIGTLVIYSSWAEHVKNCAGFAGPGAAGNAVLAEAVKNANAAAAKIPCADECKKTVTEIWRGWGCGNNPLTATGAVELKIGCDLTKHT